ncbi:hypothetical protein ACO0LB_06260 [Undibacterium sp. SXout7W]|uniref:hypothetical protein n=1 Tax=Undibacterium sp. SXout7W TaxID=3413049 RepID=UPI003BF3E6CF
MAVLQDQGRIELADQFKSRPLHLAWGRGLPAWDAAPTSETITAIALMDEIGRRVASQKQFVIPETDPNAANTIKVPGGDLYRIVNTPSRWVLVEFVFDYGDGAGQDIRELGLFVGTEVAANLPAGQRYFTPAQITAPGRLYMLDHIPRLIRSGATEQVYRYVLPF